MASYIIRKIDDDVWAKFKARAVKEGHPLRWVVLQLVYRYITKGLN